MSASKVPASVSTRLAAGSIAVTVACTNCTPGLTKSRYGWWTASGRATEHDVELREPEDEPVALVDQHDVGGVAELVRQPRRQLQPAKACPEHHDAHRRTLGMAVRD